MPPVMTTLPFGIFATLLLLTGAMRLVELAVSARRFRARPEALVAEPALFPAMALLHGGLVFGPMVEVVALERPFVPWLFGVSVLLLVAATALRVWTLRTIAGAWNVRVVAPREFEVATTGPYAYIRHPNYLVVILELLALPLLHAAWWSAVALFLWNAAVLFVRIRTEEATLLAVPAWKAAFENKARFVPGVF